MLAHYESVSPATRTFVCSCSPSWERHGEPSRLRPDRGKSTSDLGPWHRLFPLLHPRSRRRSLRHGHAFPPRPTIQITSKYAAILTFPLFGDLPHETVLSTVCQLPFVNFMVSRMLFHSGRSEAAQLL